MRKRMGMQGREKTTQGGNKEKRKSSDMDRSILYDGHVDKRRMDNPVRRDAPPEPAYKTSEILAKEYWPLGYSEADVNKLTFDMAVKLRTYQDKQEKSMPKINMPGQEVKRTVELRPVDTVEACVDDGKDKISPARFLRPAEDIKKWWPLTPKNYGKVLLERKLDDRYGTWSQIPRSVFTAAHNLGWALEMKHFCPKNYNA